ncbi:MAG: SAM-dependent methyltransferase, partial [Candidatus Hodarchaeota archaeon]
EGGWGIEVVNEAKKYIKLNKLEDRIHIIYSDVFSVEIDHKFDVIFMSNFLQAFKKKEGQIILKKSYDWLKSKGIVAIQDNFLDEKRLSPPFNTLFDFYLNLESPNARLYSFQEINEILLNAGFTKIKKNDILFGMSHIISVKEGE